MRFRLSSRNGLVVSRLTKRALIAAVVTGLALFGALGAYAYWTTGGSGSGTATVGTTTDNLTIASPAVTGITPGSSTPVTVTVTNPNSYSAHVDTVSTVITTSDLGCLPSDFSYPPKVINSTIAPLGTSSFTQDLVFADTAADQSACKGATITLTYSSS